MVVTEKILNVIIATTTSFVVTFLLFAFAKFLQAYKAYKREVARITAEKQKKLEKKVHIIKELLTTERHYVNSLQIVCNVFMKPLLYNNGRQGQIELLQRITGRKAPEISAEPTSPKDADSPNTPTNSSSQQSDAESDKKNQTNEPILSQKRREKQVLTVTVPHLNVGGDSSHSPTKEGQDSEGSEPSSEQQEIILDEASARVVFSDIDVVRRVNEALLNDLEALILGRKKADAKGGNWLLRIVQKIFSRGAPKQEIPKEKQESLNIQEVDIGPLFSLRAHTFKLYTTYINNYPVAAQLLSSQKKVNKNLQLFLTHCKEKLVQEKCRTADLDGFLIMPVQRLPRYVLLLQELLKTTDKEANHTEFEALYSALEFVKNITEYCNEKRRDFERRKKVKLIQESWGLKDLVTPARRFAMEAKLKGEIIFDCSNTKEDQLNSARDKLDNYSKTVSATPRSATRTLLTKTFINQFYDFDMALFTDLLLIKKQATFWSKESLMYLNLSDTELGENKDDFITLADSNYGLKLHFESATKKQEFVKEVTACLRSIKMWEKKVQQPIDIEKAVYFETVLHGKKTIVRQPAKKVETLNAGISSSGSGSGSGSSGGGKTGGGVQDVMSSRRQFIANILRSSLRNTAYLHVGLLGSYLGFVYYTTGSVDAATTLFSY